MAEVRKAAAACPQWTVRNGRIRREYAFEDFAAAFAWMTAAARVAEKRNHHPNWTQVYNRVRVDLTTHDAGGLTALDFALARAFDRLARVHGAR
jgi:4a-hydroxytetrahydrobiopterin dehydratase